MSKKYEGIPMRRALEKLIRDHVLKDQPELGDNKRSNVLTVSACKAQAKEFSESFNDDADAKLFLTSLCISQDHLGEAQRQIWQTRRRPCLLRCRADSSPPR